MIISATIDQMLMQPPPSLAILLLVGVVALLMFILWRNEARLERIEKHLIDKGLLEAEELL